MLGHQTLALVFAAPNPTQLEGYALVADGGGALWCSGRELATSFLSFAPPHADALGFGHSATARCKVLMLCLSYSCV